MVIGLEVADAINARHFWQTMNGAPKHAQGHVTGIDVVLDELFLLGSLGIVGLDIAPLHRAD